MTYRLGNLVQHVAVIATLLFITTTTHAQSTGELRADASRERSRIALDIGIYTHSGGFLSTRSATFVQPSLDVNLDLLSVSPELSFSLDLTLRTMVAYFAASERTMEDSTYYRAGNGYLGVRVAIRAIEGLRVRAGFGVVTPFLNAYHEDPGPFILSLGQLPNAGWDPWLTWRGMLPGVLRADIEYRHPLVFVGLETAMAFGPVVTSDYEGSVFGAQVALWAGVRPIPELAIGLRAHAVMSDFPRTARSDGIAPYGFGALTPFVRGEFGDAFVESRFVINVADNDWTRFAGEKSWGLYFVGGFNFAVAE